jgi:hypothetical protein
MAAQKQILTLAEGIGMGVGMHGRKETGMFAKGLRVDLGERKKGWIPKFRQATRLGSRGEVDDQILEERVRAKIGKHASHSGSLNVNAAAGTVSLSGPILAKEVEEVLQVVRHVPGVKEVENRMEIHADADGVPGLQGTSRRSHEKPEILREKWSPSLRLTRGLVGIWLMASGKRPFGIPRMLMKGAGSALLFRSWRNRPLFGT